MGITDIINLKPAAQAAGLPELVLIDPLAIRKSYSRFEEAIEATKEFKAGVELSYQEKCLVVELIAYAEAVADAA